MLTEEDIIARLQGCVKTARDFEESTETDASLIDKSEFENIKGNYFNTHQKRKFLEAISEKQHLVALDQGKVDEKENAVKVLKTKVTSASDDILTARKRLRVAVLEVTNFSSQSNSLIQKVCTVSGEKAQIEDKLASGNSLLSEVFEKGAEEDVDAAAAVERLKANEIDEKDEELDDLESKEMELQGKVTEAIKEIVAEDLKREVTAASKQQTESSEAFWSRRMTEASAWFSRQASQVSGLQTSKIADIEHGKARVCFDNGVVLNITFTPAWAAGEFTLKPVSVTAEAGDVADVIEYGIAKEDLGWILQQAAAIDAV